MLNQTLFESLRTAEKTLDKKQDDAVYSILKNLKNTLNTRRGSVQIADNYGMPDLTNLPHNNTRDSVTEIEKLIKNTIESYEPRLKNVKVNYKIDPDDNTSLKFNLSAETVEPTQDNKNSVIFETIIVSSGIIKFDR